MAGNPKPLDKKKHKEPRGDALREIEVEAAKARESVSHQKTADGLIQFKSKSWASIAGETHQATHLGGLTKSTEYGQVLVFCEGTEIHCPRGAAAIGIGVGGSQSGFATGQCPGDARVGIDLD